ncbi:MAG: RidA family protein [Desulfosarcina sp.]|nr:RidA family protein [Desulfobacterales bacterium]
MDFILTNKAPAAIGPYSQAVKTGGLLFCSGQIGIDPSTGRLSGNGIKSQTKQVLNNLKAVLLSSGLSLADVVKTTIFLVNMDDFLTVNEIYGMEFGDHKPARATVQVSGLPLGALVEIECMAEIKIA